jgi:hypothetical protein
MVGRSEERWEARMAAKKQVEKKEEHFTPYPGLASEKERLGALGATLYWVYSVYSSHDQCLKDLYQILTGLRVGESSTWGWSVVAGFLAERSLDELHGMQREVLKLVEWIPMEGPADGVSLPLSGFPPAEIARNLIRRDGYYVWAYDPRGEITVALITKIIMLRFMNYVDGLHEAALTRCTLCDHVTLRRHPRGKTFCSPQCRWKSAVATRQARGN